MKILIATTYFEPYKSGLSVYAFRLAAGLSELGHEVVVVSSQYLPELPGDEDMNGFRVIRVPVAFRLSKGVVMPSLAQVVKKWVQWADVVNLHLPQFESRVYAKRARQSGKAIVVTYHCDLNVSGGWFNRLAGNVTTEIGRRVLEQADLIVQNSLDYAENSPLLRPYVQKVEEVPAPVEMIRVSAAQVTDFKEKHGIRPEDKVLGLAGRVAAEKGFEYLAEALPEVLKVHPEARVLHAGLWKSAIGEEAYQARIEAMVKPLGDRWQSLGFLEDEDFRAFFGACTLLVFSSLNSTESFGMVQIEAMLQGTPVVASDLPGVRQPVLRTGMGKIIPIRNSQALAQAVISILDERHSKSAAIAEEYLRNFARNEVARKYESLFQKLVKA